LFKDIPWTDIDFQRIVFWWGFCAKIRDKDERATVRAGMRQKTSEKYNKQDKPIELLMANITWGGTFVVAKYALEELSPILLALTRLVISSLFFLSIIYLSRRRGQYAKRRDFRTIILLGLLGFIFFYVF